MLSGKWEQIPVGKGPGNDWNDGIILRFQKERVELPGICFSWEFHGGTGGGDWEGRG